MSPSVYEDRARSHNTAQSNIFVDEDGHACVADFGLSIIGDATDGHLTTTISHAGSMQWTSPERMASYASDDPPPRRTYADDVYAYGCVGIEVGSSCGNNLHGSRLNNSTDFYSSATIPWRPRCSNPVPSTQRCDAATPNRRPLPRPTCFRRALGYHCALLVSTAWRPPNNGRNSHRSYTPP